MYSFFKWLVDTISSFFGVLLFTPLFLILIVCLNVENACLKRKLKRCSHSEATADKEDESSQVECAQEEVSFETRSYFGGAILGQERIGKGEKKFFLLKFRSMIDADIHFDCSKQTVNDDDARVTTIGRFIRRFKIDELLQLVNVLRGEMSLVGPRPLLPTYESHYKEWMKEKFKKKPGMTGLAQVNGGTHLSLEERSYYDVYYVRKIGLFMDVKILLKTVAVIFAGERKFLKKVPREDIASFIGETYEECDLGEK